MPKVEITGIDAVSRAFADLEANLSGAVNAALFDGAKIAADEVKAGLQALPVQEDKNGNAPWQQPGHKLTGITSKQKEDLIDSMGIAAFRKGKAGATETSIGFDGYGRSTWRNGQPLPNQVLMREVESGTSWMQKHPVIRPAISRTKAAITAAMTAKFKEKEKINNG